MSINKKYIMAGMLATALVVPLTDTTDSHADDTRVITGRVNFRTGPDKSYPSMGKIEKGETVTYLGISGNWIKVTYNFLKIKKCCLKIKRQFHLKSYSKY